MKNKYLFFVLIVFGFILFSLFSPFSQTNASYSCGGTTSRDSTSHKCQYDIFSGTYSCQTTTTKVTANCTGNCSGGDRTTCDDYVAIIDPNEQCVFNDTFTTCDVTTSKKHLYHGAVNNCTCTAPNCTLGTTSCGSCSKSCGTGTQTCYHDSIKDGTACKKTSFSQSCVVCAYCSDPSVSLTLGTVATTSIKFTWSYGSSASSYSLTYCKGSTCHTISDTSSPTTVTGLSNNTKYAVKLSATNCHGTNSTSFTATTLDPAQLVIDASNGTANPPTLAKLKTGITTFGSCTSPFTIPVTCTSTASNATLGGGTNISSNANPNGYTFTNFTLGTYHNLTWVTTTPSHQALKVDMGSGDVSNITANYTCITPIAAPTNIAPVNGTNIANAACQSPTLAQRISWTAPAATPGMTTNYKVVITDNTNNPSVVVKTADKVTTTYYDYAFTPGHSYNIKVYAQNGAPGAECSGSVSSAIQTNIKINSCIKGNVYLDYNGNGAPDPPAETGYPNEVVLSNPAAGGQAQVITSVVVPTVGNYTFANVVPGTYNISVTLKNGFHLKFPVSGQPVPVIVNNPNVTQNFGIQPGAPTCTLSLITANPTKVNPDPLLNKNKSTLSVSCTPSVPGQPLTYTWHNPEAGLGTITAPLAPVTSTVVPQTAVYTAPFPFWQDKYAHPSVTVCNPGTTTTTTPSTPTCTGATVSPTGLEIVPLFSIIGNIYLDDNKSKVKEAGESNYLANVSVTTTGGTPSSTGSNGTYKISNLPAGAYTVTYNGPPNGYALWYPKPASFTVTVGNNNTLPVGSVCNTAADLYGGALCDNAPPPASSQNDKGNITNLNFGITNSFPWTQCAGGDCTMKGGDYVPPPPPSTYASNDTADSTKGYIYLPNLPANTFSFCPLTVPYNVCLDRAAAPAWVIGWNSSYSYDNSAIDTSFADLQRKYGSPSPTPLANATLPIPSASFPQGAYLRTGDLTLSGAYHFTGNSTYVILVNGKLTINSNVLVDKGSILIFAASGGITVDKAVTSLDGWYSSDTNITIQSKENGRGTGANCANTSPDPTLNGADSPLLVNGNLITGAGGVGSLTNNRDLCLGNKTNPALKVVQRLDFLINAPPQLIDSNRSWREVAP